MKTISKRELVKRPALASSLKPGETVVLEVAAEPLVVTRLKRKRLTAEEIGAALAKLGHGVKPMDGDALLQDLRA